MRNSRNTLFLMLCSFSILCAMQTNKTPLAVHVETPFALLLRAHGWTVKVAKRTESVGQFECDGPGCLNKMSQIVLYKSPKYIVELASGKSRVMIFCLKVQNKFKTLLYPYGGQSWSSAELCKDETSSPIAFALLINELLQTKLDLTETEKQVRDEILSILK